MINYVICIPIVFIFFFATKKAMLLTAGLLIGLPFGCFACLGEAYASEICPIRLRAYMTGYVNICWNIGTSSRGMNLTATDFQVVSYRVPSSMVPRPFPTTGPGESLTPRNGSGQFLQVLCFSCTESS